jgi:hypothetical protein
MNWGSDILKVGNSLGIGSPAIYYQDKVHTLSDWDSKTIEIIESGGESSKIKTTFNGLKIGDQTINVTEIWSIEEGDLHSTIALSAEGGLPADMKFATGIVKHLLDHTVAETLGKFILSTWGVQSFHKQNLGMAILADTKYKPTVIDDELSHLVVFENGNDGTQYGFLADWSESIAGAQTADEFQSNLKLEIK